LSIGLAGYLARHRRIHAGVDRLSVEQLRREYVLFETDWGSTVVIFRVRGVDGELEIDAGALVMPAIGSHPDLSVAKQAIHRLDGAQLAVWCLRMLILVPFVFMAPEIAAAIAGHPGAAENISASIADVLGTSSFMLLMLMLAVTPVNTITGWRWHLVLRRDFGLGMFAAAAADLILAAVTTGDRFHGGLFARVGGRAFLAVGTIATLLMVPLAMSSTRRAQRWLGKRWKQLHRITYVVWGLVLLHLLLIFGFQKIVLDALLVSLPLLVLRLPAVRRWWASSRRMGTTRWARRALALALVATFVVGYAPFARELTQKGVAAFQQHPVDDG
jgi:sulfoxide reductase heme-binding subunit YedZ